MLPVVVASPLVERGARDGAVEASGDLRDDEFLLDVEAPGLPTEGPPLVGAELCHWSPPPRKRAGLPGVPRSRPGSNASRSAAILL